MRWNRAAIGGLIALSLTSIHCGSDNKSTLLDATQANRTVAGVWQTTSGDMFTYGNYSSPKYVELNENGRGAFYFQNATQALFCEEVLFSVLTSQSMAIQRGVALGEGMSSFSMNLYQLQNGQLSLSDGGGGTLVLSQATAVPEGLKCKSFASPTFYRDLTPPPDNSTGLAYDGTKLWYTGDATTTAIYPFDLATQTIGTPVTGSFGQYLYVHAIQSGEFWTHCNCGGSESASRRATDSSEKDKVDTINDPALNHRLNIDAMAWDGSYLWLYGRGYESNAYEILKIDSDDPANTLLSTSTFDLRLRGLTWDDHGKSFWAVGSQGVYKIDPATMKVTATYQVPDTDVDWYGIAAVGTDLYLVGQAEVSGSPTTAVFAKVTP